MVFHHKHDATIPSPGRTSQNAVNAKFAELTLAPEKAYSLDGFEAMVLAQA
jgi:hypothetical protein